ncbi:MAG: septal ring lytic transglycosylase RlpA family protein [Proteobacteria bacterium]|nr:septal ring lytic transglycosylase RlpA family protein [Pseudomonadota bacterium]
MTVMTSGALVIGVPLKSRFAILLPAGRLARLTVVTVVGLTVANCASQPQQRSASNSREIGAFADAKKYGYASPRVVADGEPVPKGGGRYHVGNTYRVAGRTYTPSERPVGHSQTGLASWYGAAFHGRKTANGEVYDRSSYTAAHPTMPIPSYARVTNLRNSHSIIVRVNDRGPFHGGRVMDVSERVANALDFKGQGTTRVRIDYLGRAGLGGSDDIRLAQSLRTDGTAANSDSIPASFGRGGVVQVASADPVQMRPAVSRAPVVAASRAAPQASAVPETDADDDATPTNAAVPAAAMQAVRGVPVPQSRPFDLGTIPGASSPLRATKALPAPARLSQNSQKAVKLAAVHH